MVYYLKLNLLKKQTGQNICFAINAVKLVSRERYPSPIFCLAMLVIFHKNNTNLVHCVVASFLATAKYGRAAVSRGSQSNVM